MVSHEFIFIFLFRTNGENSHLCENVFCQCYCNFSEVLFWKLLDHGCVQSSFSTITRQTYNSTLKDTIHFWAWINMHANSFLKTWVNIMILASAKVTKKLSVAQKSKPPLRRTLRQNISLIFVCFFFNQTNLDLKCNIVLTGILGNFSHKLFTFYLLIIIW